MIAAAISMKELVLDGRAFRVSIVPLLAKCRLFRENRSLLAQPTYDVRSRVSLDSFRKFVEAIGGTKPDITDDNAADLTLLSDELKFTALSMAVTHWRAAPSSLNAVSRPVAAAFDEPFQSPEGGICVVAQKADRLQQGGTEGDRGEITAAVMRIRGENTGFVREVGNDIDLLAADGAALATEMWALEGELGGVWEAIVDVSERQMQEEDERRAAIDDVRKEIKHEQDEIAEIREATRRLEREHERLQKDLAQVRREANEQRAEIAGLKRRVEAVEQDNRRLSEGHETMRRDLRNMQQELAKLKEEIKRMKMTKVFVPFVKQGGQFGVPNGIIAHLTRECGGNVHDYDVVEVTSGSFEKVTEGANPHSGAYNNHPYFAAKNAADLETHSYFFSA
jgi:predicted  nucleic acid-binding Zn-ribbon protein